MTRKSEAWLKFLALRAAGLAIDAATVAVAYVGAILLRFDFQEPRWGWRATALSGVTVVATHLVTLVLCGTYRQSWRRLRTSDLPRYFLATAFAACVLTALRYGLPSFDLIHVRPPYSVTPICFVLATFGLVATRLAWRGWWTLTLDERDLLKRTERRMNSAAVREFLHGKTVMITGAGGSIGSELVRQVAEAEPKAILMVERGENALYEIDREMRFAGHGVPCVPLMVDVLSDGDMEAIFRTHHPEVVLHAAAYKHVPMVEANVQEAYRNNTVATRRLAALSVAHAVGRFVLISTDKAINPVSAMGRTKLLAEKAIMEIDPGPTRFCAVRFGNVFGSSGSVVPLFREQIARRRPVTVTHPEMRRYFMTVSEAVGLVLQAASRTERAVYTLDMGKSVRIVDLAEGLIRQAGYRPYVDIPIVFTGIRPGERLAEELDISEKSAYRTDMAKIYITRVDYSKVDATAFDNHEKHQDH